MTIPLRPLDLVGIGFGPGNLGLAIAASEHSEPLSMRFLERQSEFGWHRGMLIPDARMQISFLKDLVTLRNPSSTFSFLAYLKARGRLIDFLNRQSFFPTRIEFHDYLGWAARRFEDVVDYGADVTDIRPVEGRGEPLLEVTARRAGHTHRLLARSVVVAAGLAPHLPPGVVLSERVWHNSDLVFHIERFGREHAGTARRFVVVGAGQSAAESVEYLHRSFPSAEVHAVHDSWGYSPADDSPFANRVFDPEAAHAFHRSPPEVRERIVARHRNTNYSVVDPDLITDLYEKHYAERVAGVERLHFHRMSRVASVDTAPGGGVEVSVLSGVDGTSSTLVADSLVYATGYRSRDPGRLLGGGLVAERGADGTIPVGPDYRLPVTGSAAPIFVQGATERTHGLASTLLSNVAERSGEILAAVLGHRAGLTYAAASAVSS
ncbi:lysine N(6)-hydroxylase/L-ornithine N(5)-oxygenase family protein [Pseudonocardia xishanensis]|uniref:L-lysine N6-monooxygenase MbtG n=1 Tax=Pseudonocardia xishanensis TaxID=630995 RepID=A0ABP8S0Z4_9PSEU